MIKPTVEQNMKAARLLKIYPVDLSNPSDLLDAVKALGEKKGISIIIEDYPSGKRWSFGAYGTTYLRYEEAALAALDSVEVEG